MCHNFKNIVLVQESFDDKTELWHVKNSFIVPVNYIEPILEYTKQNDLFQLTKTPKKLLRQEDSPYAHRYYGCITPIQTKKQDVKKLAKRTRKIFADYDPDCIEIWENQLGQLEVEQISGFWDFDQSPCDETKTPESLPLLANFSDDVSINETPPLTNAMPPSRRSSSYRDSKVQQNSLNSLYM